MHVFDIQVISNSTKTLNVSDINIGIDMMGGDYAPSEAVKGIALYLNDDSKTCLIYCIGNEAEIQPLLDSCGIAGEIGRAHV